jgi:hypothetical protein
VIDVWNRVMTNLTIALGDSVAKISSTVSYAPAKFPTVAVEQIDNRDYAVDLENTENAVMSVIRILVFSNKNITEARNISGKICDVMRQMGYRRSFGPEPVLNASDTSIFRMEMRFRNVINGIDQIQRFE